MPDILIRGMEMPKSCADCPMCYDMMECTVSPLRFWHGRPENEQFDFCNERHPSCLLLELPPHGDLIDRRELLSTVMQVVTKFQTNNFAAIEHLDLVSALLRGATVVVPAERSEP